MSEDRPGLLDGAIWPGENPKLFGHAEAEAFLAQSYRSGKGHHALLIEGPEGIGKATLTFRFAIHVLTNPNPATAPEVMGDPDLASPLARQIAAGASHDLLHLTRPVDEKTGRIKSAITVDEVRRAGRFLSQTSGTGNWRIVVLDPADDMNRNAANAVLKILEEPPKRSLFLVLSHAPGKLLATIRSRCLSIRLSPLDDASLGMALDHLGVDPRKRHPLSMANGSVSQALKLLNYGGSDILQTYRELLSLAEPSAHKAMLRLADVLSAKDSDTVFDFFVSCAGEDIAARARQAAMDGNIEKADLLSRLYSNINESFAVSDAYNLDRKQTIISALEDIHKAVN